jgi:hypothetical protein
VARRGAACRHVRLDRRVDVGRQAHRARLDREERAALRTKITGPGQKATLSAVIQDGMRAVTVRVNDVEGVGGFVLPGDHVDVLLTRQNERANGTNDVVIQNARVLAVDQLADDAADRPTVVKAVTLEVDTVAAQKIALAASLGNLSLMLRRAGEQVMDATRRVTTSDLSQTETIQRPPEAKRFAKVSVTARNGQAGIQRCLRRSRMAPGQRRTGGDKPLKHGDGVMGKESRRALRPDRTGRGLKTVLRAALMLTAATLATGVVLAPAHSREVELAAGRQAATVKVSIGKSESVRTGESFSEVIVSDPEIADAIPLTDRSLSVLGKKIGTSRVSVYGEGKKLVGVFDIEVSYDTSRLCGELAQRFPHARFRVSSVNGRIMLAGTAPKRHDGRPGDHRRQAVRRRRDQRRERSPPPSR